MSFFPLQAQPFFLAGAGASIGDSSLTLSSFKQIDGTTNITMADLGTIMFGTVEPGNGTQEEQISFTGVTQNANGTATLTGISTVAFSTPYTTAANFAKTHAGGAQFVLSNTSGFYSEIPFLPDSGTFTGIVTFTNPNYPRMDTAIPLPTLAAQLATKAYVDSVAIAGAPNADTLTKGIVQLAVATQAAVGTATGSTGASLVPPNSLFSATPSATIIIPVTSPTGKLAAGFGGTALGLATLDTSTLVVQNPANATTVATAAKIPIASAGPGYLNSWIDPNTLAGTSTTIQSYVAGENIDASAGPLAVYLKESDGRVYRLDATSATEAAYAFIGFAIVQAAVTTGNPISIQTLGRVAGFSGLSVASYYYGTNTPGVISTTGGTASFELGRAVTATTLLIQVGKKLNNGTTTFASTATTVVVVGFKATKVRVHSVQVSSASVSSGGWDATGGNACVFTDSSTGANNAGQANAWVSQNGGAGTSHIGTVASITSSTFALGNVKAGAPGTVSLFYEVEG